MTYLNGPEPDHIRTKDLASQTVVYMILARTWPGSVVQPLGLVRALAKVPFSFIRTKSNRGSRKYIFIFIVLKFELI